MATAYSDDLRRKLLEAYERNEGSLAELADRFSVSLGWAKKISAHKRRTGRMERDRGKPRGPASKLTVEIRQQLQDWISEQADLTLAEMQLRLYEQRQLKVSLSRLWTVLRGMGMRLKKVPPRLRARHQSGPVTACRMAPAMREVGPGEPDFSR